MDFDPEPIFAGVRRPGTPLPRRARHVGRRCPSQRRDVAASETGRRGRRHPRRRARHDARGRHDRSRVRAAPRGLAASALALGQRRVAGEQCLRHALELRPSRRRASSACSREGLRRALTFAATRRSVGSTSRKPASRPLAWPTDSILASQAEAAATLRPVCSHLRSPRWAAAICFSSAASFLRSGARKGFAARVCDRTARCARTIDASASHPRGRRCRVWTWIAVRDVREPRVSCARREQVSRRGVRDRTAEADDRRLPRPKRALACDSAALGHAAIGGGDTDTRKPIGATSNCWKDAVPGLLIVTRPPPFCVLPSEPPSGAGGACWLDGM